MPGKVDEKLWDRAKASAKKQHPDWDDKNPRLWKLISAIYKKMGGKFSKAVEKSLASIDAALALTPAFIEDPRLWVGAIKKSCGSMRWDTEELPTILAAYGEAGGKLIKSSMLDSTMGADIEKAAGVHKYANRVPRPGGGYRYIYPEGQGPGQKSSAPGAAKKLAPPVKKAPGSTKPGMKDAVDKVNKKDTAASRADIKRKEAEEESRKKALKKSQDEFDAFAGTYREDIKKSLAESHPEWDAETLERRVDPQVRQMFRLHGA